MASWALACKNCCKVFPETAADYYLPTRPAFPLISVEGECSVATTNPPTKEAHVSVPTLPAGFVAPDDGRALKIQRVCFERWVIKTRRSRS